MKHAMLFGNERFLHPFVHPYEDDQRAMVQPKTVMELIVNRISSTIRQKESWWLKMHDPTIRDTWIREIREQEEQNETPPYHRMTDKLFAYLFAELEDHEKMTEENNGMQLGPYDRIWFWDNQIAPEITSRLIEAVKPLEEVPEAEKDWHPGSNKQVLDLVHPSICPLVYGETYRSQDDKPIPPPAPDHRWTPEEYHSTRFLWLPSDFDVSEEGKVKLLSPYINNIHPEHHSAFVPVLESIIQNVAIPLWEHVLSDLCWKEQLTRFGEPQCIWSRWQDETGEYGGPTGPEEEEQTWSLSDEEEWQLQQSQLMVLPDVPEKYEGNLKSFFDRQKKVKLAGGMLQIIVKLANIILTPEKPNYAGGKWHVEGMNNEHIVSTFIYYYDSHNIQDATLNFRNATADGTYHFQDDSACMKVLYEYERPEPCVQEVGGITTKKGRCLAFPNLYQHQVSPFELIDPTQPGYRKILVFFLIDPTCTILSATDVPVRLIDLHKSMLLKLSAEENSRLSSLPAELVDYIASLTPGTMTRKEAEEIREELIEERVVSRNAQSASDGLFGKASVPL